MTERIIIAGAGGQGIMLMGKVIAEAAMREHKQVTWLPAYGAEVRGGTAYCMVVVSDQQIGSPYVSEADSIIIMNEPSLLKFKSRLRQGGSAVVNSNNRFTEIALKMGNVKVANMVALGAYLVSRRIVKVKTVLSVMKDFAPAGKDELFEINRKALDKGMRFLHG